MAESPEPNLCKNPVNEKHDRQVSNDKIITQDNVEVQVMGHDFSF